MRLELYTRVVPATETESGYQVLFMVIPGSDAERATPIGLVVSDNIQGRQDEIEHMLRKELAYMAEMLATSEGGSTDDLSKCVELVD